MKTKLSLSILAFGLVLSAFSQTIELTFNAVYNTQNVMLDSIYIENLTQGADTTIYAPDNILVLDYLTGIGNETIRDNKLMISQNYPNPFQQQTSINLYVPERDRIKIRISNLLGQEVGLFENELPPGDHTFTFYPGNQEYYILTAYSSSEVKTIKMISMNRDRNSQCRFVYGGVQNNQVAYRSEKAIAGLFFTLGDELRYIGYANTTEQIAGSDFIEDEPLSDQTYAFEIIEGIPCKDQPYIVYEDKQYKTVLIGDQCWTRESLNIGTMIYGVDDMSDNGLIEKYCYNNDTNNCNIYGGLYQWEEMMQYASSEGVQGICPDGWKDRKSVV